MAVCRVLAYAGACMRKAHGFSIELCLCVHCMDEINCRFVLELHGLAMRDYVPALSNAQISDCSSGIVCFELPKGAMKTISILLGPAVLYLGQAKCQAHECCIDWQGKDLQTPCRSTHDGRTFEFLDFIS